MPETNCGLEKAVKDGFGILNLRKHTFECITQVINSY